MKKAAAPALQACRPRTTRRSLAGLAAGSGDASFPPAEDAAASASAVTCPPPRAGGAKRLPGSSSVLSHGLRQPTLPGLLTESMTDVQAAHYLRKLVGTRRQLKLARPCYMQRTALFRKLVGVLRTMEGAAGVVVGERTYAAALELCYALDMPEGAGTVRDSMRAAGVELNVLATGAAMALAVAHGEDPTPLKESAQRRGLVLGAIGRQAWLSHLARTGRHAQAVQFMQRTQRESDAFTRCFFLRCCPSLAVARAWYEREGFIGAEELRDGTALTSLLHLALALGDAAEAAALLQELCGRGLDDGKHWNMLGLVHLRRGDWAAVEQSVLDMQARGHTADAYTFATLFSAFALKSAARGGCAEVEAHARTMFEMAVGTGFQWCQRVYGGYLEVLCTTGNLEEARRVRSVQRVNKVKESKVSADRFRLCELRHAERYGRQRRGPAVEAVPLPRPEKTGGGGGDEAGEEGSLAMLRGGARFVHKPVSAHDPSDIRNLL
eukprot:Rhum_TRINITY_DN3381_c0_g2::Rhum_TRINITY_DN3381_c0_g2_i1::g.10500::m.10500